MPDNRSLEQHSTSQSAKSSHNPLDEAGDSGSAARGQSSELNAGLVQRKGGATPRVI